MALACLRPGYNIYSCVVRHIISAYEGPGSPKFTELSNQITVELKDVKIDTAPISAYLMYLEEKLKGGSLVARIEAEVTTPLVVHVRNPYMAALRLSTNCIHNLPSMANATNLRYYSSHKVYIYFVNCLTSPVPICRHLDRSLIAGCCGPSRMGIAASGCCVCRATADKTAATKGRQP